MIVDRISRGSLYPFGEAWEKAFEFLLRLTPEAEEKEYPLQGRDIYARVMSYATVSWPEAKLEAHRVYVDIQSPLIQAEGIDWFPRNGLAAKTPYLPEKDVEFFERPGESPGRIFVLPGSFAAFWPEDAHMPKLSVPGFPPQVKKVVVKIRAELLKG